MHKYALRRTFRGYIPINQKLSPPNSCALPDGSIAFVCNYAEDYAVLVRIYAARFRVFFRRGSGIVFTDVDFQHNAANTRIRKAQRRQRIQKRIGNALSIQLG